MFSGVSLYRISIIRRRVGDIDHIHNCITVRIHFNLSRVTVIAIDFRARETAAA